MQQLELIPQDRRKPKRVRVYHNHIRRLQEQNRLLSEMLAQERKLRKEAYAWYQRRLDGKFWLVWAALDLLARRNR